MTNLCESYHDLIDVVSEQELNIEEADENACVPQGLICYILDGSWILDGSVSLC